MKSAHTAAINTLGVALVWNDGRTPDGAALILQVLGFRETIAGTWRHPEPLPLHDLTELHRLLRDPSVRSALFTDDMRPPLERRIQKC